MEGPNPGAGAPVQTIFISKSFPLNKEVHYIDSQVKYGVRYHYSIKQVRLVFGNRYSYEDLKLFYSIVAGNGRAVGNALGFYREPSPEYVLDDFVNAQIKVYTPDDEDLSYSSVGIEGPSDNPSIQTGYYIFKAPHVAPAGPDAQAFANIFNGGTGFVRGGDDSADAEKLQNIKLTIKEGFGFTGNESGGAVGEDLIYQEAASLPTVSLIPAPSPKASSGPTTIAAAQASSPSGGGPTYAGPGPGQTTQSGPGSATGPSMNTSLLNQLFGGN